MQITVKHNLTTIEKNVRQAQRRLESRRPELLNQLGTQALSMSQRDYRKKARRQRGTDGIQWAPLKRATLEARVRRRSRARSIVAQRKKLAEQIRDELAKNKRHSKDARKGGTKRQFTARAKRAGKSSLRIAKLRQKRKDLSAKLQGLVDKEVGKHEIGVASGLQRSSSSPGFDGGDGQGGNVFQVGPSSVTVGYNRKYSKHFDDRRPLLPDPIPPAWQEKLDKKAQRWVDQTVKELGESN